MNVLPPRHLSKAYLYCKPTLAHTSLLLYALVQASIMKEMVMILFDSFLDNEYIKEKTEQVVDKVFSAIADRPHLNFKMLF